MRRGFLINSAVLILIIPLLLLLAVYSSVQSQVMYSQSERLELQRLSWTVSYVQEDLKNALRISGKRALVAMIDYVTTTGRFLNSANTTMRDLMITGEAPGIGSPSTMKNQTLEHWLKTLSQRLRENGLILLTNGVRFYLQIDPLDSFQIAIKAKLMNVTIMDPNGKVVYRGSLPTRGYVYSVININGLEDPIYAVATGGRYHRIINACDFAYPEIGARPVKWVLGVGNSTVSHIVGNYYSDIYLNSTTIWTTSPQSRMSNLSANPLNVFNPGDRGVLYYGGVSVPTLENYWPVSTSYNYRINFTLTNFRPNSLTLLVIDMNDWSYDGKTLNQLIAYTNDSASIEIFDSNGNQVPFWIEYWSPSGELWLWIKTSQVNSYSLYFSNDSNLETRGYDVKELFYLLDDFLNRNTNLWSYNDSVPTSFNNGWLTFNANGETEAATSKVKFKAPFFVRWAMNTPKLSELNAGVSINSPSGGSPYLDVVVKYGPIEPLNETIQDITTEEEIMPSNVIHNVVQWPYSVSNDSATLSNLSDMVSKLNPLIGLIRYGSLYSSTVWILNGSDARTAEKWLDEQLAKINGTVVRYRDVQIPIYLNATQAQAIEHSGNEAAIEVVNSNGKPVPFWIEYWNSNGALIWVKVNLTESYYTKIWNVSLVGLNNTIYNVSLLNGRLTYKKSRSTGGTFYYITLRTYAATHLKILYNTSRLTRGNGSEVFLFFDDFSYLKAGMSSSKIVELLREHGWNVEGSTSYLSAGNGILELKGDDKNYTPDVWLWTKKTFPYYRYVIGLDVKISGEPFWGWYVKTAFNGDYKGWIEDVWEKNQSGHLYKFDFSTGKPKLRSSNYKNTGGKYKANAWTQVEIAIKDWYDLFGDHYANFTTYQNQTGPFIGTWRGNTREVSHYDGYYDNWGFWNYIPAENNTAIGLGQTYKGPTEYDFIYVRRYLNLTKLHETVTERSGPVSYEATGSITGLTLWKDWKELKSSGYGQSGFNRYELDVSAGKLDFTRVTGLSTVSYTGNFTGSWNVSVVAKGLGEAEFDWIIVGPPYVRSGVSFGSILGSPKIASPKAYSSAAFDVQPFLDCLENDAYFGVYAGPSFFERLEGKLNPKDTGINGAYWNAAKQMQKALGLASDGRYYPIGLVSFVYQPADESLYNVLSILGLNPNEAATNDISSADYYWLSYYFPSKFTDPAIPARGYRIWGISWGTGGYSQLTSVPFFLDDETADAILGRGAWNYLRYG